MSETKLQRSNRELKLAHTAMAFENAEGWRLASLAWARAAKLATTPARKQYWTERAKFCRIRDQRREEFNRNERKQTKQ